MVALGHIAGIPVEEAALGVAPVATVLGSLLLLQLRGLLRRERDAER